MNLDLETPYKNFFTNNFAAYIFVFTIAIIYALCKHNKLRTLVASLALQQAKEVSTLATKKEDKNHMYNICTL